MTTRTETKRIVTAVNSHDALVTALKNLCAVAHAFEGHPKPSDPVHAMLPLAIKLAWDVIALAAAGEDARL